MVHAIIVLPGTTGTDLFANQVVNPTPPPPAPNPPAVWLDDVWNDASEAKQAGVQPAVAAMNGKLWATLPSGSADKNGSTTGYIALMGAIIDASLRNSERQRIRGVDLDGDYESGG